MDDIYLFSDLFQRGENQGPISIPRYQCLLASCHLSLPTEHCQSLSEAIMWTSGTFQIHRSKYQKHVTCVTLVCHISTNTNQWEGTTCPGWHQYDIIFFLSWFLGSWSCHIDDPHAEIPLEYLDQQLIFSFGVPSSASCWNTIPRPLRWGTYDGWSDLLSDLLQVGSINCPNILIGIRSSPLGVMLAHKLI
jgi:hypothetical protein